jgi:NAD(P)-dependent dehydrogenase (short-subunit alcohol dehydrogenase family)
VVTGATTGIGLATARELVRRGGHVLLVARDARRGADALADVRAAAGRGGGTAEVVRADLSRQAEVRALAAEVRARHERVHVLVNNAGAVFDERRESADGVELTLALNHLAYWLLTAELLPALRAAGGDGGARVVVVASDAHTAMRAGLVRDDLELRRGWTSMRAYAQSKLANVMFAYALARRLAGTGVTANALHPGVVASNFARGVGGPMGWFFRLGRAFLISPERGAATSVFLAAEPSAADVTGGYYKRRRATRSSPPSYDEAGQEWLWAESARLTGSPAA